MPKMKTNRGAAKRFKRTGTGKFKRLRCFHQHNFTKKSPKRRRFLRQADVVGGSDHKRLQDLLPYV